MSTSLDNFFDDLNYNPDIYTLEDEEGNEESFELIDTIDEYGVIYYAFVPCHEDPETKPEDVIGELMEDDAQFVILKAEEIDGEEMLVTIDDEEEYERIGRIFLNRVDDIHDVYNFDNE